MESLQLAEDKLLSLKRAIYSYCLVLTLLDSEAQLWVCFEIDCYEWIWLEL